MAEPILDRDTKLATLTQLAAERGLPLTATLAVGDGANDLDMLQRRRPRRRVSRQAGRRGRRRGRGWITPICARCCSPRDIAPANVVGS